MVVDEVERRRTWRAEWGRCVLLFGISLLLTGVAAIAFSGFATDGGTDYRSFYRPVGESIASGDGLYVDGEPAVRYPPGYPLALAPTFMVADAFGVSYDSAAQALSVVATGLSVVLVYVLMRAFLSIRTAFLAALFFALHPLTVWYGKNPLSEPLFSVVLLLALVAFVPAFRNRTSPLWWAALAGALAGAAALIRPIGIALVVPMLVTVALRQWGWGWRRPFLVSGLIVAGVAAIVVPWELWAHQETGDVIPLSAGGPVSIRDGLTFGVHPDREIGSIWLPGDLHELMDDALESDGELGSLSGIWNFGRSQITENPAGLAELAAYKTVRAWYGTEALNREPFIAALQVVMAVLAVYGMVLASRMGRNGKDLLLLSIPMIIYLWAMTMTALSIVRYMIPAIALMMGFVAIAVVAIVGRMSGSDELESGTQRDGAGTRQGAVGAS